MNTRNVNEIFISDGAALGADGTNIAAITSQLSFVGGDMVANAGAGKTGKILYDTAGYTTGTQYFTMVVQCIKQWS